MRKPIAVSPPLATPGKISAQVFWVCAQASAVPDFVRGARPDDGAGNDLKLKRIFSITAPNISDAFDILKIAEPEK